jgi:putative DNA primase/helicase
MSFRKSAIKNAKQSLLTLVREFSTPVHFWRGEWFAWAETHYDQIAPQGMEQQAMAFLEQKSPNAVTGSMIRRFVDLLRVVRYADHPTAPCWLTTDRFPAPAELFAVDNGLLHIAAAVAGGPALLPHDPAFFNLSAVSYNYRPTAGCPRWRQFLNELWGTATAPVQLLQEWFGYCLLPDTAQQKILAISGPPRSGKSTITRVLRALLGSRNVACPSIRSLSGQFGIWGLLDKLVAIVPDAMLLRPCPALEELLKAISGEDAVDIHRKGLSPLTGVRLPTRIVIVSNDPPKFCDPSCALDRRIVSLHTHRSFFGAEDITLTNTLLDELPGILNWAIEGWQRLQSRGHFDVSQTVSIDPTTLLPALPDQGRVSQIVIHYQPQTRRRREHHQRRSRRHRVRSNAPESILIKRNR